MLERLAGLRLKEQNAELIVQDRVASYGQHVVRGELLEGRPALLRRQLENLDRRLGSPAIVFSWAASLEGVERKIDRAKQSVMDLLVALEYLAVRLFLDERLQIELSTNPYQLERILDRIDDSEERCGRPVNTVEQPLSLKNDLLGFRNALVEPITAETISSVERFRRLLLSGSLPVDRRSRHGQSDHTIGNLFNRKRAKM